MGGKERKGSLRKKHPKERERGKSNELKSGNRSTLKINKYKKGLGGEGEEFLQGEQHSFWGCC